jgi:hypothetical protein
LSQLISVDSVHYFTLRWRLLQFSGYLPQLLLIRRRIRLANRSGTFSSSMRRVATISFWRDRRLRALAAAIHFDTVAIRVERCLLSVQSLDSFCCSRVRCCDLLQSSASACALLVVILVGVARHGIYHRVICLGLDSF